MSHNRKLLIGVAILAICALSVPAAVAQPVPGGTLDPLELELIVGDGGIVSHSLPLSGSRDRSDSGCAPTRGTERSGGARRNEPDRTRRPHILVYRSLPTSPS